MVLVLKKTREELAPLAQRKFAGFFLGPLEPKGFMAKVGEIIGAHSVVSPYFVTPSAAGLAEELTISIEAAVVGRSGEQLVSRSTTEVDPSASMLCIPINPDLGPALFRMATNLREGEEIFNLFPLSRIVGVGRKWVMGLPEIKIGEKAASKTKKIILYEPNEQRLESFKEILKGYDIDVLPAKTLSMAASILKRDPTAAGCVYLHELMNDASGIEWKNVYGKLSPSQRPPLIVGTSSMNARSTPQIRYIKRPFGMGLFIEMIEASCERGSDIAEAAGKNANTTVNGVAVRYQAAAKLLGLDETGGVLLIKFPLVKGSRLTIDHAFLEKVWEGNTNVQITAASSFNGKPDVWHARFEAVGAGMSKVKYWDRISKQITITSPEVTEPAVSTDSLKQSA
jgi:hypothetical protein